MMKLLIAEKFSSTAQIKLTASGLFQVERLKPEDNLFEKITDIDFLIIRSKTKITKDLLLKAEKLKCIITCTSGFDHIDLTAAEEKNIAAMYTPDANATAAAELTWALALSSARHILSSQKNIKTGIWNRDDLSGFELSGKTYGIIGLGRIGQKVATYAKAFGMDVSVFDPYQDDSVFEKLNLPRSSYEEVLKQSDLISYHVPLTKETKNMLNRSHYEFTNPNVLIINTCRGGVVNEDDLVYALENKLISGCALDVFEKEPVSKDSKLFKFQNALLTQHIGALTEEAFEKASLHAVDAVLDYIKNKKITNGLPLVNNWGSLSFKD
jgi:D-3-phosphoglycerate dehydrogenase / 2-oxoglutarate reductase